MKKTTIILALGLLLLTFFTGCEDEKVSATLRVEMDKGSRTIAPETDEMEVYGYRVIPVGPDGKEASPRYTYYSYINLDGLTTGQWKIKVYAFSKDRKDLAYGEETVKLAAGKNTLRIAVTTLIGDGSLSLKLLWDKTQYPSAYGVAVTLKDQDGKEISINASSPSNGVSTVEETNLKSGSYVLQGELRDRLGNVLSGFTEAIRISAGVTTEGSVTFLSSTPEEEMETTATLSNQTSIPINLSINGIESLVEANTELRANVSVITPNLTLSSLTVEWHLDGRKVAVGPNCVLEEGVPEGLHRLDAVASTSDRGSVGSATIVFQAAASTSPGAAYQKNTIQDGTEYKLGRSAVAKFLPDNRLLIASNTYRTVQLVDFSQASPTLVKETTYSDLSLEGDVADFASYGDEDDQYYSVIFLCNSESACRAVNVIVSRNQITYNDMAKNFDISGSRNPAIEFVNIVPGDQVFVATIQSKDKMRMGYIYFNMDPIYGQMVNRKDWYVDKPELEYGYSGFKNAFALSATGHIVFTSGQRAKVFRCTMQATGKASVSEMMMWDSWDDYIRYYNAGRTKAEFSDGQDCGFLTRDAQYAYVFSTEGIYYYRDRRDIAEEYQKYHVESLEGRNIGDIRMCPDVEFGYMVDNDTHRLYTMTPKMSTAKGGYILEEGNWIALDQNTNPSRIEISLSGTYVAVYDKSDVSTITVVKTAR